MKSLEIRAVIGFAFIAVMFLLMVFGSVLQHMVKRGI